MTPDDVIDRIATLRERIATIERTFDHPVRVLGVTKGHAPWAIHAAVAAGCDGIGESYAQELLTKRDDVESAGAEVHFVGRLQSNKVRQIADLVDVWSSLDRSSVVDEVAKRAPGAQVLIQVDTMDDPAKGGCPVHEVDRLVERAIERGLHVRGLMTVGPTGTPPEAARAGFATVRRLVDDLGLAVCSMGMSADLDVAVQEGSTEVRIGSGLFGPRPN